MKKLHAYLLAGGFIGTSYLLSKKAKKMVDKIEKKIK